MNEQEMFRNLKATAPSSASPDGDTGDWMQELETLAKDEGAKVQFENIPTVGCGTVQNPRKLIKLSMLSDPKVEGKTGEPIHDAINDKDYAWAEGTLNASTQGWDRKLKQDVQLTAGTKVSIDFARHKGFWMAMKPFLGEFVPETKETPGHFTNSLAGRKFIFATVGRIKTGKGLAFDYRVKEEA